MQIALLIAAFLAFAIGMAHSYLGERYILTRLFRMGTLPKLYGGTSFTRRTLRFAWHVTTVAWWGFAVLLLQLSDESVTVHSVALVIACTFCVSTLISLLGSRGRHFSWLVFLAISLIAFWKVWH